MRIPRFYQASDMQVGNELELSPVNHRHAIQVLRLKTGENIVLFNGRGGEYSAKIITVEKKASQVLLESHDCVDRESTLKMTLAVANIKSDKMDFAIQKAVELGVTTIQPVYTQRSVIKIKTNRLEKKMRHWQGVIVAACEQSGRTEIPRLNKPCSLNNAMESCPEGACIAMLPHSSVKLKDLRLDLQTHGLTLFIGPEGGFSPEEEKIMRENSVESVNFGKRILRAETAAVAGITACQQQWGDL